MRVTCRERYGLVAAVLLLAAMHANTTVRAQPISVTLEGAGFAKGPSASEVRTLARSIIGRRFARFGRCDLRLTGESTACDVHFTLQRAQIATASGQVAVKELTGRIPVGNILVLVQGRMRWPESMLAKDIRLRIDGQRLSACFGTGGAVRAMHVVPAGGSCRFDVEAPRDGDARKALVRHFLDKGLSLTFGAGTPSVRLGGTEGALVVSGALPTVFGSHGVESLGAPTATPWGSLAFACSVASVAGRAQTYGPERMLAAQDISAALTCVQDDMDNALEARTFVERASVTDTGDLLVEGMAVVGLFQHVERLRAQNSKGHGYVGPTIELNVFR